MPKTTDIVDYGLLAVGSWWSLANIEHILGIIILVIQLVWLITKLIVKIIHTIKEKKALDVHDNDVNAVIDIISDMQDTLTKKGDEEENE